MGLRPEQDPRLLAATHRMRVRRHYPAQECIQSARCDPGLPTGQRLLDRRTEAINMTACQGRNVDLGCPLELNELTLDLPPR